MFAHKTYIIFSTLMLAAALFTPIVQAAPSLQKRQGFSGDGTYYSTGMGACGKVSADTDFIAALNKPQWGNPANPNSNPICGQQAHVCGPNGCCTVTVVDLCPECLWGSLDLSPSAFAAIANMASGRVHITWTWLDGSAPAPAPTPTPKPTPTPTPTPTSTTTTSTTSTTSTTKTTKTTSSTPTPTETLNSVAWPFMKGMAPYMDPSVVLANGENPLLNTQNFLSGDIAQSDGSSQS